ncbi:hypothetical protein L5515_006905 [Caenorhabditis briggsae]|uniref:Uncharacterized protein n=1 Tax=Caenorhabditis briggsae TaxID=6238 RepID=A0AAE9CYN4_CAEBR|nr:hypothetical protein L3Y34_007059 [Caenorhabditis briggsae]UMM33412.1 hypothetical protein L5515_006905 [Caenorhabditis briggsae]
MADDNSLLDGFEIISLEDVVIIGDSESKPNSKPSPVNEVDRAREKLAEKLRILKEDQIQQKLEREQIKKDLDDLKRSNDERRRKEDENKKSNEVIEAKLAKLEDYEKARKMEFEKYLKRYKDNQKTPIRQQSVDGNSEFSSSSGAKIKRAQSERMPNFSNKKVTGDKISEKRRLKIDKPKNQGNGKLEIEANEKVTRLEDDNF